MLNYTASNFKFDSPFYKTQCIIDEDFKPQVDTVNSIAAKYGIYIYTTSSFRFNSDHIAGAVVTPAQMSNHFVGHAFDFNLFFNGKFYTSKELHKDNLKNLPVEIQRFIAEVEAAGIRWGGEFHTEDDIHLDSGLNIKAPQAWLQKYNIMHEKEV